MSMQIRLLARLLVLALLGLAGCFYFGPTDYPRVPNPPFSKDKGIVILFVGFSFKGQDVTSGMDIAAQELHRRGITAQSTLPPEREDEAKRLAALPGIRSTPVAVVGYSIGGPTATWLAEALKNAGVPVQTLVVIEGWGTGMVPCNVRKAVDIFNRGLLSVSKSLVPGPGFTGEIEQIDYAELPGARPDLNHYNIAWAEDVRRLIMNEVLDGDRVRTRPAPPGEAACLTNAHDQR
jgi:pimeloyl-ACP methyl ester carboxylesterase